MGRGGSGGGGEDGGVGELSLHSSRRSIGSASGLSPLMASSGFNVFA